MYSGNFGKREKVWQASNIWLKGNHPDFYAVIIEQSNLLSFISCYHQCLCGLPQNYGDFHMFHLMCQKLLLTLLVSQYSPIIIYLWDFWGVILKIVVSILGPPIVTGLILFTVPSNSTLLYTGSLGIVLPLVGLGLIPVTFLVIFPLSCLPPLRHTKWQLVGCGIFIVSQPIWGRCRTVWICLLSG